MIVFQRREAGDSVFRAALPEGQTVSHGLMTARNQLLRVTHRIFGIA